MLCVHVTGDELDALAHEFSQNGFSTPVNGCHLDQLNEAPPRVAYVARLSPSRLELSHPLADQLTLQRPPLLIRQVGHSDFQHDYSWTACQKPLMPEARISLNLLALSTIRSSNFRRPEDRRHLR
jgi:hypothetical protein